MGSQSDSSDGSRDPIWFARMTWRGSEICHDFDEAMHKLDTSDVDWVRAYVEGGNDLSIYRSQGRDLLHIAARSGNAELVSLMLQQPSLDPNEESYAGFSALSCACNETGEEVIRVLLADQRTDPNLDDEAGYPPLHYAVLYNLRAVEVLIDHPRVDIDVRNWMNRTPFLVAIQNLLFTRIAAEESRA